MKIFYKIFGKDSEKREDIITVTSGLGIAANLLIAAVKIIIGLLSSSIAIISEGANNATDALSSVLTLVGTKIAGKHPDKEHPFGYRRIEYLTGLVVSVVILVTGIEMLISSVKLVFAPEEMSVSYLTIAIVAITAIVKFVLGTYTIRMGKKAASTALEGVGLDCRNDSFASVISIVSALLFIIFGLNLDAYAGIIISLLIIKAGVDVLKETLSEIIGRAGDKELAEKIYAEVRGTEGVLAAVDMMLHNYGPGAWSGSVNIEIDHEKSVGEIYQIIHELQLKIMHEYSVTMVFGIYAVDNDHEAVKEVRKNIAAFVRSHEHVKSYHAVYIDDKTNKTYCDFIVDYEQKNWDELREEFIEYMAVNYPDNEIELTIETEYV